MPRVTMETVRAKRALTASWAGFQSDMAEIVAVEGDEVDGAMQWIQWKLDDLWF